MKEVALADRGRDGAEMPELEINGRRTLAVILQEIADRGGHSFPSEVIARDGQAIVGALLASLPTGTIDAVLIGLLRLRGSRLALPALSLPEQIVYGTTFAIELARLTREEILITTLDERAQGAHALAAQAVDAYRIPHAPG